MGGRKTRRPKPDFISEMSSKEKKITDHPFELEREKVETWLERFLPKLERSTTRTQKCRLLESVERMEFGEDFNARIWDNVRFEKDGSGNIDGWREDFTITKFQKTILKEDKSLFGQKIGRSEIKQESGEWNLSAQLKAKSILQGGEAIVLEENFDGLEVAVRVQVFDPFLFTEELKNEDISFEIHLSKGKTHFSGSLSSFY